MIVKPNGWQRAILHIDEMNLSRLSYRIDMTYSHLSKIVKEMVGRKWVVVTKHGRTNKITLTKKGEQMRDACQIIANELRTDVLIR